LPRHHKVLFDYSTIFSHSEHHSYIASDNFAVIKYPHTTNPA